MIADIQNAEVSPPCDVGPASDNQPFADVTHAVYVQGEVVYRGTQGECLCFAANHHPSGGYGIGPIQD
ncbi:hypothetical protein [Magnetospirillum sp. ME-1]|uniref:hypothetical protein n=1 Tax=Magnetospirillum sp. ME-1 TaxID=1639348 RepID=UPI0011AE8753|nr:hypothetical protein [Magnetospirillum sp. ME-1]